MNHTKQVERGTRNQNCDLIVTLSPLTLRKSWSIVCIYLQTSLILLIWKFLKGYFNFQLYCDFSLLLYAGLHFRGAIFCSHRFLAYKCHCLRLISIQKCISIDKMCGQTVWTNRLCVQKFLLLIRTKWPPFPATDQSLQVNATLISTTTAKRKTLKVNNFI